MPLHDKGDTPIRHLGLLLVDGFALMSYASVIEPFRAANSLSGRELYRWTHVSAGAPSARASNGVSVLVEAGIGEPIACDRLFVLAAGNPATFNNDQCFRWLRRLARQGTSVIGVSGGPYLLAKAGLLDGYRATIHWEHATALREDFPDLALEAGLFVIDRNRMTCAGGTAGLDLSLCLIEQDHGPALSRRVSEWFIRTEQRASDRAQRAGLGDRYGTANHHLLQMLELMENTIDEPLSRAELSARTSISIRQLERLCKLHLGCGVAETYMQIRLDRAAQLLRSTSLKVTEVAVACGFPSQSHFSRRFRKRFHCPPSRRAAGSEAPWGEGEF